MTAFAITVDDAAVLAELQRLQSRVGNLRPVMAEIGEGIVDRAKRRFGTSTAPDGKRWAPNSEATLAIVAARIGSSGRKKDGSLNARGAQRLASKRPLIGEIHALETQIHHQAGASEVTVSASPVYAAIQQFGGKKSEFPHLWGDIPARPFLPVHPDGTLYPAEQAAILADINDYLTAR